MSFVRRITLLLAATAGLQASAASSNQAIGDLVYDAPQAALRDSSLETELPLTATPCHPGQVTAVNAPDFELVTIMTAPARLDAEVNHSPTTKGPLLPRDNPMGTGFMSMSFAMSSFTMPSISIPTPSYTSMVRNDAAAGVNEHARSAATAAGVMGVAWSLEWLLSVLGFHA